MNPPTYANIYQKKPMIKASTFGEIPRFRQGLDILLVILAILFSAPLFAQAPAPKDAGGTNPAEPPEMPEPTVLDSASYLIFQDGLVIGAARYKVVRSNFSGIVFATGRQRYFSKAL